MSVTCPAWKEGSKCPSYGEVLGRTLYLLVPHSDHFFVAQLPPLWRGVHPRNLLETGSPFILLIFLMHTELMVLVPEQNSVSLLKELIMKYDKSELGVISL